MSSCYVFNFTDRLEIRRRKWFESIKKSTKLSILKAIKLIFPRLELSMKISEEVFSWRNSWQPHTCVAEFFWLLKIKFKKLSALARHFILSTTVTSSGANYLLTNWYKCSQLTAIGSKWSNTCELICYLIEIRRVNSGRLSSVMWKIWKFVSRHLRRSCHILGSAKNLGMTDISQTLRKSELRRY